MSLLNAIPARCQNTRSTFWIVQLLILVFLSIPLFAHAKLPVPSAAKAPTKLKKRWMAMAKNGSYYAIDQLGRLKIRAAIPIIRPFLTKKGTGYTLLQSVVFALGRLRDKKSAPRIQWLALNHSNRRMRIAAVWALGKILDRGSIPTLAKVYRTSRPYVVRGYALWALGNYNDRRLAKYILPGLTDTLDVCREAWQALRKIKVVKGTAKCSHSARMKRRKKR